MLDLTVIVPVHIYDDNTKALLDRALKSLEAVKGYNDLQILFVGPDNVLPKIKDDFKGKALFVKSKGADFSTQINTAVSKVSSKYFSILEFDDVYTQTWFENVEKYMSLDEEISVFLPLTEIISNDTNEMMGYVNEAVWASSFSEELGYLDHECLENYMNFNTTGGVFKTDDFVDVGMLKTSMKLTFWYEFLLRAIYNGKKVYVVPKVGYKHYVMRPDSLSYNYSNTMQPEEADWWIELAKKEYLYKRDRNKIYEE